MLAELFLTEPPNKNLGSTPAGDFFIAFNCAGVSFGSAILILLIKLIAGRVWGNPPVSGYV